MVETPSLPMPSCHRHIATLQDELAVISGDDDAGEGVRS
jgi:hypothetical protein